MLGRAHFEAESVRRGFGPARPAELRALLGGPYDLVHVVLDRRPGVVPVPVVLAGRLVQQGSGIGEPTFGAHRAFVVLGTRHQVELADLRARTLGGFGSCSLKEPVDELGGMLSGMGPANMD